jgi:hypothetical protein
VLLRQHDDAELHPGGREVAEREHQCGQAEERVPPDEGQSLDCLGDDVRVRRLAWLLEWGPHRQEREGRERVGHDVDEKRHGSAGPEQGAARSLDEADQDDLPRNASRSRRSAATRPPTATARRTSDAIINRFRSTRSPATSEARLNRTIGRNCANETTPAFAGECVTARVSSG